MLQNAKDYFRYLPISDRDLQWGLYVAGGGFNAIDPGTHYPRSGHPPSNAFSWRKGRVLSDYAAVYITRGEGEFETEAVGISKVVSGSVLLLFPGIWHRYRPIATVGWDEYWVIFNGEYVQRLVSHGFFSPREPLLKVGLDNALLHAYSTLIDRLRSAPVGFPQFLAASAMEILAATTGAIRGRGIGGQMHELVSQAKSHLESQIESMPAIEDLAHSLGLSPRHFYRVFREHSGLTPYQYHLQLRIERAKQMLRGTALSVKQIAIALDFENQFHFSHLFKQKTGVSPREWRDRGQQPQPT